MINSHQLKNVVLKFFFIFSVGFEFAHGNGLRVIRPTVNEAEWEKELITIVKGYQDSEKEHQTSKIIPLFIAIKLDLGEPVAEYGAVIQEFAYVYSEVQNKKEEIIRCITVLGRSPYENRRWSRFDVITENDKPISNVLVLKPSIDITEQITEYSKKLIGPLGARDHIISIILFDKSASEVFGKKLEDVQIISIFAR